MMPSVPKWGDEVTMHDPAKLTHGARRTPCITRPTIYSLQRKLSRLPGKRTPGHSCLLDAWLLHKQCRSITHIVDLPGRLFGLPRVAGILDTLYTGRKQVWRSTIARMISGVHKMLLCKFRRSRARAQKSCSQVSENEEYVAIYVATLYLHY